MNSIKKITPTGDVIVVDTKLEALKSIAESLQSIDQSLKKISGEKTEKESVPVKKSYSEKYFTYSTYSGEKVSEKDK